MVVPPYYSSPTEDELFEHYRRIAEAISIPVMVYNNPNTSNVDLRPELVARLAEIDNISCIKEASGDIDQMMDLILRRPPGFTVLSGDDAITLPLMALGGNGIISVTSNLLPGKMVELVQHMLNGDTAAARAVHYEILPVINALMGLDTNPIPVKGAMHAAGLLEETYRLPMTPLTDAAKQELRRVLKEHGVI